MAYTTINKSTDNFNTKLYTGNSGTLNVTGVGFQPDFTWIKSRTSSSYGHDLYDAVRGATKTLNSNNTNAEYTEADRLQSFDSDGFTLGSAGATNSSTNYVSWNWKANGAGSSNTDGSITSTVSANQTAGFSIVKYTGTGSNATVGHGLGATMDFAILRRYTQTSSWLVYHKSLGATKAIYLNETGAVGTNSSGFNDTAPTSSVFTIGNGATGNTSSADHIAYCFAEKTGYSKFGSYTGNGSTDGTFVYTGFKPAFVMIKKNGAGDNWIMYDNKINLTNVMDTNLYPNLTNAEDTSTNHHLDFLSNGFKWRTTSNTRQGSGSEVIYMAFGQSLVGSNNIPCTAR